MIGAADGADPLRECSRGHFAGLTIDHTDADRIRAGTQPGRSGNVLSGPGQCGSLNPSPSDSKARPGVLSGSDRPHCVRFTLANIRRDPLDLLAEALTRHWPRWGGHGSTPPPTRGALSSPDVPPQSQQGLPSRRSRFHATSSWTSSWTRGTQSDVGPSSERCRLSSTRIKSSASETTRMKRAGSPVGRGTRKSAQDSRRSEVRGVKVISKSDHSRRQPSVSADRVTSFCSTTATAPRSSECARAALVRADRIHLDGWTDTRVLPCAQPMPNRYRAAVLPWATRG